MPAMISPKGLIIGPVGSDNGYLVIGPNGPHRVGGWGLAARTEVTAAIAVFSAAAEVKTPQVQSRMMELANSMLKPHMEYIDKAFDEAGAATRAAAE